MPTFDKNIEQMACGCRGVMYCSLHAAAPTLLKALEQLVGECEDNGNGDRFHLYVLGLRLEEARAAIALAKGETA